MRLPPVRAIFFDAVGTLIHPEPPAALVYQEIGHRYGSRLGADEIRRRFAAAFKCEDEFDRVRGWRTDEAREVERWQRIVAAVLDDVSGPETCFQELFAHFSQPEAWRCHGDAQDVLGTLAARGYRLGLASNYDSRLRSVVPGLPPLRPVQHLIISSEVGWRKPASEFFQAMCEAVRLPPEQVLYVGDDFSNDVEGGRAAGLPVVFVDPSGDMESASIPCIKRLAQLLLLLSGR